MGLREVPPSQAEVLNPPLLCHCLMFDKEVNINIPTFFFAHFGTFYSYSYSFQRILANRAKKIFKAQISFFTTLKNSLFGEILNINEWKDFRGWLIFGIFCEGEQICIITEHFYALYVNSLMEQRHI